VPLIVMEYVAGGSLRELLQTGPLPPDQARDIVAQVAAGMSAAHGGGIVHGDLKPENILISRDGAAKVTDFGLARRHTADPGAAATLTWDRIASGGLSGTPAYMAPELLEGERPSPASDVFALGLVLYEALMGRKAVTGTSILEVIQRIRDLDPQRLASEVPQGFGDPVGRMLQRAPQERPTMPAVVDMLARDSARR
jgi:serine/threonine protein kinase